MQWPAAGTTCVVCVSPIFMPISPYFSALAIPVGTWESWKHDAPRFLFWLGVMETLRQWCSMWTMYKQTCVNANFICWKMKICVISSSGEKTALGCSVFRNVWQMSLLKLQRFSLHVRFGVNIQVEAVIESDTVWVDRLVTQQKVDTDIPNTDVILSHQTVLPSSSTFAFWPSSRLSFLTQDIIKVRPCQVRLSG